MTSVNMSSTARTPQGATMDPTTRFIAWGRQRRRWADTTCDGYRRRVASWLDWCQQAGVRDTRANAGHINDWLDSLHPTAAVRSHAHTALLAWFDWRVDTRMCKTNPVRAVDRVPVRRTIPRSLSDDEARAVLEAAAACGARIHCYIGWLLYAGLRRAEACGLRWVDIEGRDAWVRVLGKGGQERVLPIHDELRRLLVRHRTQSPHPVWIFPGRYGGPICTATGTHWGRRVLDGAGLPNAEPHMLRHTYATSLAQNGWDLPTVMAALGHSSLSSTTIYTRARPDRVALAVASLDWSGAAV